MTPCFYCCQLLVEIHEARENEDALPATEQLILQSSRQHVQVGVLVHVLVRVTDGLMPQATCGALPEVAQPSVLQQQSRQAAKRREFLERRRKRISLRMSCGACHSCIEQVSAQRARDPLSEPELPPVAECQQVRTPNGCTTIDVLHTPSSYHHKVCSGEVPTTFG